MKHLLSFTDPIPAKLGRVTNKEPSAKLLAKVAEAERLDNFELNSHEITEDCPDETNGHAQEAAYWDGIHAGIYRIIGDTDAAQAGTADTDWLRGSKWTDEDLAKFAQRGPSHWGKSHRILLDPYSPGPKVDGSDSLSSAEPSTALVPSFNFPILKSEKEEPKKRYSFVVESIVSLDMRGKAMQWVQAALARGEIQAPRNMNVIVSTPYGEVAVSCY